MHAIVVDFHVPYLQNIDGRLNKLQSSFLVHVFSLCMLSIIPCSLGDGFRFVAYVFILDMSEFVARLFGFSFHETMTLREEIIGIEYI